MTDDEIPPYLAHESMLSTVQAMRNAIVDHKRNGTDLGEALSREVTKMGHLLEHPAFVSWPGEQDPLARVPECIRQLRSRTTSEPQKLDARHSPAELDATRPPAELDATRPPAELDATRPPAELDATRPPAELSTD